MYAVIRIGGQVNIPGGVRETIEMMNLHKNNHCTLLEETSSNEGMLNKAKDQVTWGEIDKETLAEMILKRGRLAGDEKLTENYIENEVEVSLEEFAEGLIDGEYSLSDAGIKSVFRLNSPSKGFKNTKRHFPNGSLGYREDKINNLLKRMI